MEREQQKIEFREYGGGRPLGPVARSATLQKKKRLSASAAGRFYILHWRRANAALLLSGNLLEGHLDEDHHEEGHRFDDPERGQIVTEPLTGFSQCV